MKKMISGILMIAVLVGCGSAKANVIKDVNEIYTILKDATEKTNDENSKAGSTSFEMSIDSDLDNMSTTFDTKFKINNANEDEDEVELEEIAEIDASDRNAYDLTATVLDSVLYISNGNEKTKMEDITLEDYGYDCIGEAVQHKKSYIKSATLKEESGKIKIELKLTNEGVEKIANQLLSLSGGYEEFVSDIDEVTKMKITIIIDKDGRIKRDTYEFSFEMDEEEISMKRTSKYSSYKKQDIKIKDKDEYVEELEKYYE